MLVLDARVSSAPHLRVVEIDMLPYHVRLAILKKHRSETKDVPYMLNFTGLDALMATATSEGLIDTAVDMSDLSIAIQQRDFLNWFGDLHNSDEYSPTAHKDIVATIYIAGVRGDNQTT